MAETNETGRRAGDPICDALRFLCEASYAVLPREVAYKFGEFEKNFWGGIGWLADKKINWIDEALRGGDRLREEWQQRHTEREPQPQTPPPPDGMG